MSTDLVNEMKDEMDDVSVVFQEAIQTSNQHGKDNVLFCFVEGEDDLYYYPEIIRDYIKTIEKSDKHLYSKNCGNKDKVNKLYYKLLVDSDKDMVKRSLFFVDKDFEKIRTIGKAIYITPTYSIENLFANVETLKNFLNYYCRLSEVSIGKDLEDFKFLLKYYQETLQNELAKISLLNAWFSLQKEYGCNDNELDGIRELSTLIKQTDDLSMIDLNILKQHTSNHKEVSEEKLKEEILYISQDLLANSRGKYVEFICTKIYQKIIKETNNPREFDIANKTIGVNLGKKSFKVTLGMFAYIPPCLLGYISERVTIAVS